MGVGGAGGRGVQIWYAVDIMQLGSSRHPRTLRVRSTIQLTYNCDKGMTNSSEIDVVINNGDDDDEMNRFTQRFVAVSSSVYRCVFVVYVRCSFCKYCRCPYRFNCLDISA